MASKSVSRLGTIPQIRPIHAISRGSFRPYAGTGFMKSIWSKYGLSLPSRSNLAGVIAVAVISFVLGGVFAPSVLAAERTPFKVVDGDGWLTSNANYDANFWAPTDQARPSFGLQLSERNDLPFDRGTAGATVWVRNGSCGVVFKGFGDPCGWQLGLAVTQFRSVVVGGQGMEIDGLGLPRPYARVINSTDGTSRMAGLLSNAFVDFSGVDDPNTASWFSGFDLSHDGFAIRRAAPGSRSLSNLVTVDAGGNLNATGDVAARHVSQPAANRWASRAALVHGTYTFRFQTAFAQPPVCVATSEGTARVRVSPAASHCTVTSDDSSDAAMIDVIVIGNPN
jgi:hypothetical protein